MGLVWVSILVVGCGQVENSIEYLGPMKGIPLDGYMVSEGAFGTIGAEKSAGSVACKGLKEAPDRSFRFFERVSGSDGGFVYRCQLGPKWRDSCVDEGTYKGNSAKVSLAKGAPGSGEKIIIEFQRVNDNTVKVIRVRPADSEGQLEGQVIADVDQLSKQVSETDLYSIGAFMKACGIE